MRNASSTLISLLNSASQVYVADLLTITPVAGSAVYLTSAQTDITITSQVDNASHTFKSGGTDASGTTRPTFSRGGTKLVIGTEVDSLDITLMSNIVATVGGLPWTQQARLGYLDGARIALERAFTATWGDWSAGTLITFWGRVASVKPSRNTVSLTVNSDLVLLQQQLPRNVYQAGCLHNLYDTGCTLVKASFTVSGSVSSGSTASAIKTNRTEADGYFALGGITFTSGVNNGLTRTVKSFANTNGLFVPVAPFPSAPGAGDTFTAFPGCDKQIADPTGDVTLGTCKVKFNNLQHARGYPFVPSPENGA